MRVGDRIGRNRRITAKSANQFRSLSGLISSNKCVLLALACFELQRLILCLQAGNLVLGQEIKDSSGVRILSVNNITGAVLNQVAGIARLGSKIITNALNRVVNSISLSSNRVHNVFLATGNIAAAVSELRGQVAESLLVLITKLANCVIN